MIGDDDDLPQVRVTTHLSLAELRRHIAAFNGALGAAAAPMDEEWTR